MPIQTISTEHYFTLTKEILSASGQAYVRVTGDSMRPLLRHLQDGVILVPPEKIRWGDVVLFDRRNGHYALHRVIWKKKISFHMAGDNQWHIEYDLPYSQIVGVVACICRRERRIPASNLFLKVFNFATTLAAFPRIYCYKAMKRILRPIRNIRR